MGSNLTQLKLRDQARRQQRIRSGFVNFTLEGPTDLFNYGFNFTKVKIGSPPREYNLIIDTGSEISWMSCIDYDSCPMSTSLEIQLQRYSPKSSSSSSVLSCLDKRCPSNTLDVCNSRNQGCRYEFEHADESWIAGLFVSDIFHLDTLMNESASFFSTSLIFGCTKNRYGMVNSDHKVDGVLGLNAQSLSLRSQLASPRFFHCIGGGQIGRGVLIFGELMDPRIIYTPLDLSQGSYNLYLQSITLNDKTVHIDPAIFILKNGGGTIVNSGTTLIILAERAYDPVINSLTVVVSAFAQLINVEGYQCFRVSNRLHYKFPPVSFNFKEGVSMTIQPKNYLMWMSDTDGTGIWCIGFKKIANESPTILGEIILQNKTIVYDLVRKRLGWVNHDWKVAGRSILANVDDWTNCEIQTDSLIASQIVKLHFIHPGLVRFS